MPTERAGKIHVAQEEPIPDVDPGTLREDE